MTTSGDYARCFVVNGVRYGHILNPRTGWPVRHLSSVTVAAEFCLVAGSASTIAMLKESEGPSWLASLGLPHLWVMEGGACGGSLAPHPHAR
jgi:thiamine biosynthesis lipoprotein